MPSVTDLRDRVREWLHREPRQVTPRTILIVDGDGASRESTARRVEALGYQSLFATGIAEALDRLEDQNPEFVLLGFDLADTGGLDALKQIRQIDPEVPVIMLATDLWDARVPEAMRQGAVAYLARPFGLDDLREVLGRR
ncbi:MAG TPA: response regulator [Chloroflexota bacterium]